MYNGYVLYIYKSMLHKHGVKVYIYCDMELPVTVQLATSYNRWHGIESAVFSEWGQQVPYMNTN